MSRGEWQKHLLKCRISVMLYQSKWSIVFRSYGSDGLRCHMFKKKWWGFRKNYIEIESEKLIPAIYFILASKQIVSSTTKFNNLFLSVINLKKILRAKIEPKHVRTMWLVKTIQTSKKIMMNIFDALSSILKYCYSLILAFVLPFFLCA